MRAGLLFACVAVAATAQPPSRVFRKAIRADAVGLERGVNLSFEQAGGPRGAVGWEFWERGFELVAEARGGARAVRCRATDPEQQYGAQQSVTLDQTAPVPVTASGWSKAEGVDGSPDSGYSIYVDINFADGTSLWGQTANFSVGTHDWQRRQVMIVPTKPIRSLTFYGLFRGHRGTVWFDDLSLKELSLPAGAARFDGVAVEAPQPAALPDGAPRARLPVSGLPPLEVDRATGAMALAGDGQPAGGIVVRDVFAQSDFLQPVLTLEDAAEGATLAGVCPELRLRVAGLLQPVNGALVLDGEVTDLSGQDRAVTVTWALPLDLVGGTWPDDARAARPIEAGDYVNTVGCQSGATGTVSHYPIAAPYNEAVGAAIGYPLDHPRLARCGYDADGRTLYASVDLGLSAATAKSPSRATFRLVLYGFNPSWGFRAALAEYYRIFPELFVKRVQREGIWMPFTDIATVQRPESFGFQFKEGNDNVPWDEQHGIDTFVYIEPMSYWMGMAADVPRTYDAALAQLRTEAATEGPRRSQARATLSSAIQPSPDGPLACSLVVAPWSDGALFINNPDPDVPGGELDWNQGRHLLSYVARAFEQRQRQVVEVWSAYGDGFGTAPGAGRGGSMAIVCRGGTEAGAGARQQVVFEQNAPRPLVASAWCKAEEVTGEPGTDFSLYVDLTYADDTNLFGQIATFAPGTHDWQQAEVRIVPEKPVRSAAVHLLLRGGRTGTAWFDDLELREEGGDNLLRNPGFESGAADTGPAQLDGVYIDSYEMAAMTENYRRGQFAAMDLPLVFNTGNQAVCSQVNQHVYELCRSIAEDLHGRGKLFFANAIVNQLAHPAHLFDVLGIETDWAPGGQYQPNSDASFLYRRALCYQKPYCLLLNTDYNRFRPEWVDLYFQRCLFYGVFPSFFSHNAADDPYWQNPRLYNRDRPLFERVIPIIRELAAAGWEPVTLARSDNAEVWLERFGTPGGERGTYLTAYNPTDQAQAATIRLEAPLPAAGVEPIYAGRGGSARLEEATLRVTLGAQQVLAVKVR